jgi:hypothetical protein
MGSEQEEGGMAEWGPAETGGAWATNCDVCGWHATFETEGAAKAAAEAHHHDDDLEH